MPLSLRTPTHTMWIGLPWGGGNITFLGYSCHVLWRFAGACIALVDIQMAFFFSIYPQ